MPKSKETLRREAIARMRKRFDFWSKLLGYAEAGQMKRAIAERMTHDSNFSTADKLALADGLPIVSLCNRKLTALGAAIANTEVK